MTRWILVVPKGQYLNGLLASIAHALKIPGVLDDCEGEIVDVRESPVLPTPSRYYCLINAETSFPLPAKVQMQDLPEIRTVLDTDELIGIMERVRRSGD